MLVTVLSSKLTLVEINSLKNITLMNIDLNGGVDDDWLKWCV